MLNQSGALFGFFFRAKTSRDKNSFVCVCGLVIHGPCSNCFVHVGLFDPYSGSVWWTL